MNVEEKDLKEYDDESVESLLVDSVVEEDDPLGEGWSEEEVEIPVLKEEDLQDAPLGGKIHVPSASIEGISELITTVRDDISAPVIVVYGMNGTGKTRTGSTAPDPLILNAEKGTRSAASVNPDIPQLPLTSWSMVEAVYYMLKNAPVDKKTGARIIQTKNGEKRVKTVVWDTITRIVHLCLRASVLQEAEKDISRDVITPSLRDYATVTSKVSYWVTAYKDLGLNVVFLAQERANSDEMDVDGYLAYPDLAPALRNYVLGEADIIMRTFKKTVVKDGKARTDYRAMIGPSEQYVTKDRSSNLPRVVRNPNLTEIIEKYMEVK